MSEYCSDNEDKKVEDKLKIKKAVFEKELNKLIEDFKKKRKKYYEGYIRLCWAMVIVNAGISFSLGVSFVEEVALHFKVIALLLSSVLLVINGAATFFNYKKLYEQRTKTLINLLTLKREYKFKIQYSDSESDFDAVCGKLQNILEEDLDLWIDSFAKEKGEDFNNVE